MKKLLLTITTLSSMISYANMPDAQPQEETTRKENPKKNSQYAYAAANLLGIGLSINNLIERSKDRLNLSSEDYAKMKNSKIVLDLVFFSSAAYSHYADDKQGLCLLNIFPLAYNTYFASQGEGTKLMAAINLLNVASAMRPLMFEW